MPGTKLARSYRLGRETLDRIDRIARAREGLPAVRVIENAVELYHRQVIGRSAPPVDERPVRVRRRGGAPGKSAEGG